jgi:hypothetical protein
VPQSSFLRSPFAIVLLLSLAFLALGLKSLYATWPTPGTDFSIYYQAALDFQDDPARLYNPNLPGFDQFLYPPPSILLFSAFTVLGPSAAYAFFVVLMMLFLVGSVFLLRRLLRDAGMEPGKMESIAFVLLALASAPFLHNIVLGQVNSFVLFLSLLYLYLLNRKPVWAGIILSVAIWIKIYPVLLLLVALRIKHLKAVVSCVLAGIALPLLLLPFLPLSLYEGFLEKFMEITGFTSGHVINQSLTAFLYRFNMEPGRIFLWPNIFATPASIKLLNLVLLAAVLLLAWLRKGDDNGRNRLVMAAVLLAAGAMFSNLGWGHTYLFSLPLLLVGFVLLKERTGGGWIYWLLVVGISALYLVPVHNHPSVLDKLPFLLQNIYYSRLLWIGLVLMAIAFVNRESSIVNRES